MAKFSVQFTCVIEQEASSAEEAEEIARELFEQDHRMDWFWTEAQEIIEKENDDGKG